MRIHKKAGRGTGHTHTQRDNNGTYAVLRTGESEGDATPTRVCAQRLTSQKRGRRELKRAKKGHGKWGGGGEAKVLKTLGKGAC